MTIRRGWKWGGIRVIAGFWMYEAILEYLPYLQHFSSGRHPALEDFAASAAPLTTVPVIARLSGYFKPRNEVFATHLAFSRALVAQMMSFWGDRSGRAVRFIADRRRSGVTALDGLS